AAGPLSPHRHRQRRRGYRGLHGRGGGGAAGERQAGAGRLPHPLARRRQEGSQGHRWICGGSASDPQQHPGHSGDGGRARYRGGQAAAGSSHRARAPAMKRDTLGFRIGRLLLWLGMILLLLVAGVGMLLEQTLPRQNGIIRVAGTKAPVEIGRDAMGVVTVRAGSESDAAFAMGFAHAQDRLFQMDLMRRLGAGRLSEVLGAGTLSTDKFMRTLGLYRVAEANYRNLPADAQALFQAYANGVNAFLARRDSLLPAEFMALGYHPEPWRPADSIVWGRLMALWLSTNFDDAQLRLLMSTRLSPQDMQWIFPAAQRLSQREDLPGMPAMGASNNWVIAGRLTASGKPLLANDPHLGLNLPSTWYLARIEFEGRVLAGATAPGVPVVVIGRNDHVAWGFTTAYADTQDLFAETLLDDGQYATPD